MCVERLLPEATANIGDVYQALESWYIMVATCQPTSTTTSTTVTTAKSITATTKHRVSLPPGCYTPTITLSNINIDVNNINIEVSI